VTSWDLAAIAAVLLFGVPHGGLDGAVARRIGWSQGVAAWLGFHIGYTALAALVVWFWWQWPVPGLAIFLIISALHFGKSDVADIPVPITDTPNSRWLPLAAHGGLVSIAIPSLQPAAVEPVFVILVGDEGATMLLQSIGALFLPWLLSFAGYAVFAAKNPVWRKPLNSLITQLILVFLLPPLISFALYFCLWHSRGHTLRIWQSIEEESERRRCFIEAAIYSLMAWATALVFLLFFEGSLPTSIVQLTFIGLAALTVPHMLLVDLADKLKKHRLFPWPT
jgi:Brp/Blh family beta-carotene 15,15'-monooxygenase